MTRNELVDFLKSKLPEQLAADLADSFLALRLDVAMNSLGRTDAGKFVETPVQILQHLETGNFDSSPKVDELLRTADSAFKSQDDGLRVCATRVARGMYSLRSKRNIAHKGSIDPNTYDLRMLLHAAQWILAELIRCIAAASTMAEAGRLVEQVQLPVGGLVDDGGNRPLVLADLQIPEEILILLHHRHPNRVPLASVTSAMDRRNPTTVRTALRRLWDKRWIDGDGREGYRLTARGFNEAMKIFRREVAKPV